MEEASRKARLIQGAEETRELLQSPLTRLQDLEEATQAPVRGQVMEVSERLAEIVGNLYKVGANGGMAAPDAADAVLSAYDKLELTLKLMENVPQTADEQRTVARALALLYALGIGRQSSVPPLRRSSTGMRAVRPSERPRTPPSSPAIELGEIDAHTLGIDLEDLDGQSDQTEPRVPSESERRSEPRVAFEVEVGFVSETHFFAGFSMDVSAGGLFLATYQLQPVGSVVAITFVLPNGYAISTDAKVRWVREESEEASPGMGLAFDLKGEDLRQVQEFCKRREPLFIDMD